MLPLVQEIGVEETLGLQCTCEGQSPAFCGSQEEAERHQQHGHMATVILLTAAVISSSVV